MEKISRSNVNNSHVSAKDFPKSGFDLSYKSRNDFVLGFLHPTGYQYIMPADKMSFSTDTKYTFNLMSVPEISDVTVSTHNFYVPFRSIDTSFIKGIVPTELNAMSSSWRVPSFTLQGIFGELDSTIADVDLNGNSLESFIDNWRTNSLIVVQDVYDIIGYFFANNEEDTFYLEFKSIWLEYAQSLLGTTNLTYNEDNLTLVLDAIFTPIMGRNSLLDCLGYAYLRSYDIARLASIIYAQTTTSISPYLSNLPQNEYALRAYYAIWYEHYRDPFLQKASVNLPDWRDFGSSSILIGTSPLTCICFLLTRIRSWQKDMFVGAMPDDISRHVFAPIYADTVQVPVSGDFDNYLRTEADPSTISAGSQGYVNAHSYTLKYIDPTTGSQKSVVCPLPKAVNDALNTLSTTQYQLDTYGLDLRDLRKAQMLERYLKRNFYFGDEYQDRMLAHYGSNVSDNSIRRPHLLSSSIDTVNPKQEVAPQENTVVKAGTRTATAQDATHGDASTFFSEEFGIFITIQSYIPRAQYAPIAPQVMLSQMTDFPIPEFAANNDEFGRICEIALSGLISNNPSSFEQFAHYPYAHSWRSRVDEVHGSFLDDRSDYTFRRFFGLDSPATTPSLNYRFILCKPNLGMFVDTVRLNGQGYFTCDHHFYVERVLPTPVEEI